MSGALTFERSPVPLGMTGYVARSGQWQFLIINDRGDWTVSYRLRGPTTTVSASSTIRGPRRALDAEGRRPEQLSFLEAAE